MASWLNLEGKTAVVTGGASGIGKTVVQSFLDNGANVVVCDMNPEEPAFERGDGPRHSRLGDAQLAGRVGERPGLDGGNEEA